MRPAWVFVGVLAIWIVYTCVVRLLGAAAWFAEGTWPGVFGDSFGALNTLFTGLAFAAFVVSLRYQREELAEQREELKLQRIALNEQRQELARSAEAQQEQVAAMHRAAEAQERAAKAQEMSAEAQARTARVAEAAESLRAVDLALSKMGSSGDQNWAVRNKGLTAKRDELINTITHLTGSVG
ncbi:MAG: hypothetical protein IPK13_27705 [Deltaproteobacteria bacterium]|nr:hypothetical protein [Deltaproteobacteria bacterium]